MDDTLEEMAGGSGADDDGRFDGQKAPPDRRQPLPASPSVASSDDSSCFFDFFESCPDAKLIINRSGQIRFANRAAAKFTATECDILLGQNLQDLLSDECRALGQSVIAGFVHDHFPRGVDLTLRLGSAARRTASVNFAAVQHRDNLVIATMRDVTSERALGDELGKTKEFLERVIESSVDAIVSADLQGNILLFNRAACRLFGYERSAVLGNMKVADLYPPGVAQHVMKRIRSRHYGGSGWLQELRVDLLNSDGDRVPVTLSASLVMDGEQPVGTVGIFTDIREKLAMEASLEHAQRELQDHDKRAAIAELAGAAAHELNQPLTSVMGYGEFLKRSLGNDPSLLRAVDVILRETERMADIVRKVGQITRYETKHYVGGAKIVDLDASSNEIGPEDD